MFRVIQAFIVLLVVAVAAYVIWEDLTGRR